MAVTSMFKYVIDAFFVSRHYLKGKPRPHVREKHNYSRLKPDEKQKLGKSGKTSYRYAESQECWLRCSGRFSSELRGSQSVYIIENPLNETVPGVLNYQ